MSNFLTKKWNLELFLLLLIGVICFIFFSVNQRTEESKDLLNKKEKIVFSTSTQATREEIITRYSIEKKLDQNYLTDENLEEMTSLYYFENTPVSEVKKNYCDYLSTSNPICSISSEENVEN